MTSQSETGHAKNISAFKTIINFCQGYGADYNPAADPLKLNNLQTQLSNVQTAQSEFIKKQTTLNIATDKRIKTFEQLKPLTTKTLNALSVSGVSPNNLDTAKTITRKIFGKRAAKVKQPADPGQPPINTVSVSQLSYANQVAHFSSFIELLSSLPEYKPNENELKISSLQAYLGQLESVNASLTQAATDASNSQIIRNNYLYAPSTGIIDTALQLKAYVKSVYGATSPQYKQVSGIEFSRKRS